MTFLRHHRKAALAMLLIAMASFTSALVARPSEAAANRRASSDPCIASIQSSGKESVGETNYLPIGQVQNGKFVGILADIISAVNQRSGLKATLEPVTMPFDSLVPSLSSRRILISGDTLTPKPERKKFVRFATNLWYITVQMMVQKGNPQNLHVMKDLSGKTATTFEGSTWLPTIEAVPGVHVHPVASFSDMVAGVLAGQQDAAFVDSLSLAWALRVNKTLKVEAASGFKFPGGSAATPTSIAVPKSCPVYQADINKALAAMHKDGTFVRLMKKWGLVPLSKFEKPSK
jgi:ABC-type amino acid transport substrate-binding protein